MKSDKLFVYGSLMGGVQSPIAKYLKSNSDFLGEGLVRGQLLDLGYYPGLVAEENSEQMVTGHVFQLRKAQEMLVKLDYYENVGPSFPRPNQYRRSLLPVFLNQEKINCWAYLYNLPIAGIPLIESGNYLEYFKQNEAYQRFVASLNDFSRNV
jgi:gamma-glutamylcyclotransferase (GGCT)/AIG2-like uncharacterized protein YtfP